MGDQVRAAGLQGFSGLVSELGGNPETILAAAGLAPSDLENTDHYISVSNMYRSFEIAARRLKRPDFGLLLGSKQDVRLYGVISTLFFSAATLDQGIKARVEFYDYHNQALKYVFDEKIRPGFAFFGTAYFSEAGSKFVQAAERACASTHQGLTELSGPTEYRPAEIWFTHHPMSALSTYQKVFGIVPHFRMPLTGVFISREHLDAPRMAQSEQIFSMARQFLQGLGYSAETSLRTKVEFFIRINLAGGDVSQAAVAGAIGIGERTLQRGLSQENSSFTEVLDDARRKIAGVHLANKNLPLREISELLGYAELSSFSRSCRRWFGASPKAVRAQLT